MMINRMGFALLPLTVVFLSGCGAPTIARPPNSVLCQGKATLNGQPLHAGRLHFEPQDKVNMVEPVADIKKDGSYTVTTYKTGDGLPPGTYIVWVELFSFIEPPNYNPVKLENDQNIPDRHLHKESADQKIEVKGDVKDLAIDFKP